MRSAFVDTSFWIALVDSRDRLHSRAREVRATLPTAQLVTTEEVLGEFLTYFSGYGAELRDRSARYVDGLRLNPAIRILEQSHNSFLSGLDLYRRRPDKEYSFADCVSMQSMRQLGLTEVLSSDHHFEQEGFTLLIPNQ